MTCWLLAQIILRDILNFKLGEGVSAKVPIKCLDGRKIDKDWGYPPLTKSEIILYVYNLFIFVKGPQPKPSLSTVSGRGIPPR